MSKLANIIRGLATLLGFERETVPIASSTQQEATIMADATQNTAAPAVAAADTDTVLANVKKVLATAGHDVEAVWDEVVALAKKL